MHKDIALPGLLAALLVASLPLRAENWPQWRGPNFNGSTSEKGLPGEWNKSNHVVWSAPLAGPSGATPVIWGDHVFVSTVDAQKNLKLVCLNRRDGSARCCARVTLVRKFQRRGLPKPERCHRQFQSLELHATAKFQ